MDKKSAIIYFKILPSLYLIIAFLYSIFIVKPVFYFHHTQAPFLFSTDFYYPYLKYPGGLSELIADFFMQFFNFKIIGPIIFFGIALLIGWLSLILLNQLKEKESNRILALIPMTFCIVLVNNYNIPFSIIVSIAVVLLMTTLLVKGSKNVFSKILIYSLGALSIFYFSGSGYLLLFSIIIIFFFVSKNKWSNLFILFYIAGINILIPFLSTKYLFAVPVDNTYFFFFSPDVYFKAFQPSLIFYLSLISLPVLFLVNFLIPKIHSLTKNLNRFPSPRWQLLFSWVFICLLGVLSHRISFIRDARNIVASDYYCYQGQLERTTDAARNLNEYSFAANLNYNLALSKTGRLSENFFDFFQISGTEILYPDIDFRSEFSFLITDYYYQLGYISEARHWAYESLVNYPHSPRALKSLVKIHLITKEYNAAEKCLNSLKKGLSNRKFIQEFSSYLIDTSLVQNNFELMGKRSYIPSEHELSPKIHIRFQELLEKNPENKSAYEHLMLYYLLDGNLDNFLELYKDVNKFFGKPVRIYEEALLLYNEKNNIDLKSKYKISEETSNLYNDFNNLTEQYKGNKTLARNALYWEMGQSYLYYYKYVFPRIIKREIILKDDDEPSI